MYDSNVTISSLSLAFSVAIAIALIFGLFCIFYPLHLTKNRTFPDDQYKAIDETRKTVAQICGGAAIIITFAWTIIKDRDTISQSQQQMSQGWQQISNQEFISSATLLSVNNVASKIAGIHGLGYVASTHSEYHMAVRDTLIGYLTDSSSLASLEITHNIDDTPPKIKPDTQAVIEVIGRRNLLKDVPKRQLDVSKQYLYGANFSSLEGFQNALFYGSKLYGVDFRNSILYNTKFDGADFNEFEAYGKKWDAEKPYEKNDWEWNVRYLYIANFENAKLNGATFTGAGLCGAKFSGADLDKVNFTRANLSRVDFRGALNLEKAIWKDNEGKEACADKDPIFDEGHKISFIKCPR